MGSSNRKGYLSECCDLHGSNCLETLMHISIRWLSLERCLTRILQLFGPLTSYFKSLNEKQPRFCRLGETFSNPISEVYLLFYQATLPAFTTLNLLLQREQPSIYLLHAEMVKFIQKLCSKFLKPEVLRTLNVHEYPYKDSSKQLPGAKINVGFTTRATLNRLLSAGDVTTHQADVFQQAAQGFLVQAVEYAIAKLPFREPLLQHAKFVDPKQRSDCDVQDGLYFVSRFPELLPFHGPQEHDQLSEEFLDYQLMDIPMPDPATLDIEGFWGVMSSLK
ncbi:uncharacterized protein LOC108251778 [Kryptolebias marmoratus]|uniref:uncharacterized protein LOC108251778 n=1 Tax=Kryptolebias marmoratus TaxID=37003 RepID=UPI000D53113D|nr:uncharacterized protein LOC108251778 [Kryptolebias marmoratus]